MNAIQFKIQLPYTCLVTRLRMSKRQVQQQIAYVLKNIITCKNNMQSNSTQEVVQQLRRNRQRLEQLRNKLKEQKQQQDQIYNTCRKRVHLDKDAPTKPKQLNKQVRTQLLQQYLQQFNKQVVQYLGCQNKISEARSLISQIGHPHYHSLYLSLLQKYFSISSSTVGNNLRPLKEWCYQHSHFLSKMQSPLEFKLIACLFVNILNNGGGVKAVQFLRKEIANLPVLDNQKEEVDRLMFKVLSDEGEGETEYYSDEDQERERQKEKKDREDKEQKEKEERQMREKQEEKRREKEEYEKVKRKEGQRVISHSSSSNSVEEALASNEALQGVYTGMQSLISRALNPQQAQNQILQSNSQPIIIESPSSENIEQEIEEQVYEEKFDSMSEEEQENYNSSNREQPNPRDGNGQKIDSRVVIREAKRKHKLDKNSLRQYLQDAKTEFMLAFSKIYGIDFEPSFDRTLAVGISILKTSNCSNKNWQKGHCPVCTPQIQQISKKVPGTLKNQSSLICRINGTLMNQRNYPVVFPNGQIYSIKGLQQTEKNGNYFCPADRTWHRKQTCKKIFLT